MQIPELMTGGNRGDEQLRRIPSRRIAAEHWVGRAGYGGLALRADLVRTRIRAVRRRAGALIAGPVDTNRIGVTLVCQGLLRLRPVSGYFHPSGRALSMVRSTLQELPRQGARTDGSAGTGAVITTE